MEPKILDTANPSRPGAWILPTLLALIVGAALWILGGLASGQREPWDSGVYWTGVYPASLLAGAVLAWWLPRRAWRWPLLVFLGQFVGATVRAGEVSNLWPIAVAMFVALAVPGMLLASLMAWWRRSRSP